MTTSETVEGVVEARNDTGIKVEGEWRNRSKFKPVELPPVGADVRLVTDDKRFIKSVEVLGNSRIRENISPISRDRTISRLSVLKAAASFAATRTDIKSGDVLRIADSWIAWVEAES